MSAGDLRSAASWRPGDEELRDLAEGIADLLAVLSDGRPAQSRASLDAGTLTLVFRDGLVRADRLMIANGLSNEVKRFREAFLEEIRVELVKLVEALAGIEASAAATGFDPATLETSLTLTVAARDDILEIEREALRNWSLQVRRKSSSLRRTHVEQRRIQSALTADMAKLLRMTGVRDRRPPASSDGADSETA